MSMVLLAVLVEGFIKVADLAVLAVDLEKVMG